MKFEFSVLYQDDVTLGGNMEDVLHDLGVFEHEVADLGLLLNQRKSEVICGNQSKRDAMLFSFLEASIVDLEDTWVPPLVMLVPSPNTIVEKVHGHLLGIMGDRFQHLDAHDTILLLRHSFSPSQSFCISSELPVSPNLVSGSDHELHHYIHFDLNEPAWTQLSLPV